MKSPKEIAEEILRKPRYVSVDMKGGIDTQRDAIIKALEEAEARGEIKGAKVCGCEKCLLKLQSN